MIGHILLIGLLIATGVMGISKFFFNPMNSSPMTDFVLYLIWFMFGLWHLFF